MNNHTWLALVAALLLAGCAGTASEFECNATTSDRCMTMEQANDMARNKTEGARESRVPARCQRWLSCRHLCHPALGTDCGETSLFGDTRTGIRFRGTGLVIRRQGRQDGPTSHLHTGSTGSTPLHTEALCTAPRCDSWAKPPRWVDRHHRHALDCPWIDDADVFHQPGRVSFVLTPGTWQLPHQLN